VSSRNYTRSITSAVFGALACLGQLMNHAYAREDLVPGSPYTSGEGAAMGDAVLPLANDGASSLFYNPAGLARIRTTAFEPFNLGLYGNSGYFGNMGTESLKVTSLSGSSGNLQNHPGVFMGTGASYAPAFYTRGFAFGVLLQSQIGAAANSDGSIHSRSLYQLIPTAGYGMSFGGGIVRIGYSLQWINQASGDITVPSGTTPLGYNQNLAQGSALSHNVGFAFTLPYVYLPALNVVARNIGGAHFNTTSIYHFTPDPTGAPPTDPMTLDASISFVTKLDRGSEVNWVVEDRDITNQSGMSQAGRVALGLEYSIESRFFLRGGWGSGYPAAGIGYKDKKGEISLSWYSEELGQSYHALRDARYLLGYSIRAF
jgi:hypothetical protein